MDEMLRFQNGNRGFGDRLGAVIADRIRHACLHFLVNGINAADGGIFAMRWRLCCTRGWARACSTEREARRDQHCVAVLASTQLRDHHDDGCGTCSTIWYGVAAPRPEAIIRFV
jgi:hypothetical protein